MRSLGKALIWPVLILASPASAETVEITSRFPANFEQPSLLRRLIVQRFSGQGGAEASAAIVARLSAGGSQGPHFSLGPGGAGSRVGTMSGSVELSSSQTSAVRSESRCIDGKFLGKCRQRANVYVTCFERNDSAAINVEIAAVSDNRIVYATSKPLSDTKRWCEGQSAPAPILNQFRAILPALADSIAQDISPHDRTYKVKLLETTAGLNKPAAKLFKAAVITSTRDIVSSCAQWTQLASQNEKGAGLSFNLGVCSEKVGDLAGASGHYGNAAAIALGNKQVAEATARIRTLVAARANAATQAASRAQSEASDRAAAAGVVRRERAETAAAQRKIRERELQASRAKSQQRAAVAKRYGAASADAIIAGTVRKGMNPAQVRAATGGGCRIQKIAPGEEQWFCGAKRIVFAQGVVTFVK